jgi:hypothetical protein
MSLQNDPLIVGPSFSSAALGGFVVNWILIGTCDVCDFRAKWARVKARFSELGVDMHDEQLNTHGPINAIGWDWDTANGVFFCPPDKLGAAHAVISEWSSRCSSGGSLFFVLLGLLHLLQHFVPFLHARRVQFECVSEPAVSALSKGFSKMPLCMSLIRRFWPLCASAFITPRFVHILARFNTVADHLSHLRVPQAVDAAVREFNVGFTDPPYSLSSLPTPL